MDRLNFQRYHQSQLRADTYSEVKAAIRKQLAGANIGMPVILSSSFIGSPRFMHNAYLDSMAFVRVFGKPTFFITFTCNPAWPEVIQSVPTGLSYSDAPQLYTRVFRLKLQELLSDLTTRGIFGRCVGHVYSIEFQKRGLPHAHILLWLDPEVQPKSADTYDLFVRADIPSPTQEPDLYSAVAKFNIHGPCGAANPMCPCMKDGSCSKKFPKSFQESTIDTSDTFPLYRRPNNGHVIEKTVNKVAHIMTSQHVVPYNAYLTLKFQCHINVEICATVNAVKYIHKYVFKGPDRSEVAASASTSVDEIAEYTDAKYIGTTEAIWRLLGYPTNEIHPSVYALDIHLPDEQTVIFNDQLTEVSSKSSLLWWFQANQSYPDGVGTTYLDYCKQFTFSKTIGWKPRKNIQTFPSIARIRWVHPSQSELYYLRTILLHSSGATSFEELRTVNGILYLTFADAAASLGLAERTDEWLHCISEAVMFLSGENIRELFVSILRNCCPSNPLHLFNQCANYLSEDFNGSVEATLCALETILMKVGDSLGNYGLTPPSLTSATHSYAIQQEAILLSDPQLLDRVQSAILNADQSSIFNAVLASVTSTETLPSRLYFLSSPGGCGKTFILNLILDKVRSLGLLPIAVASSGVAALLLRGGRTAHSRFKISVTVTGDSSNCTVKKQSKLADLFRSASLIIWDEAPMMDRKAFDAVDNCLRDVRSSDVPFGGLTVLFAGDFRQILPVVLHGSPSQIVSASILKSKFWSSFQRFSLTENVRIAQCCITDDSTTKDRLLAFSKLLLDIGNGTISEFKVPAQMLSNAPNGKAFVEEFFAHFPSDLRSQSPDARFFISNAILTCLNDDVSFLNGHALQLLPGTTHELLSEDACLDDNAAKRFPVEFLNTYHPTNMPPHRLLLREGAPIILLRNLSLDKGLANGTRLTVLSISDVALICRIETGESRHLGTIITIHRLRMTPSDTDFSIPFRRLQFPVSLAFALTTNKSQGQTLQRCGIYMPVAPFTHGQLYVALSRVGDPSGISIWLPPGQTCIQNTVYRDAIQLSNLTSS